MPSRIPPLGPLVAHLNTLRPLVAYLNFPRPSTSLLQSRPQACFIQGPPQACFNFPTPDALQSGRQVCKVPDPEPLTLDLVSCWQCMTLNLQPRTPNPKPQTWWAAGDAPRRRAFAAQGSLVLARQLFARGLTRQSAGHSHASPA
jgi:hypothetical protein